MSNFSVKNESYSGDSNVFVFYKDEFSTRAGAFSFTHSESYQESGATVKRQVNQQSPVGVAPGIFLNQSNTESVDDTRNSAGTWRFNQYSYQELVSPLIVGAREKNYLYFKYAKTETVQATIQAIQNDKLHWHYGKEPIPIEWHEKFKQMTPNFGATLKGNNYYCVTPSLGTTIPYGTGVNKFWKKAKSDYRNFPNIYNNPEPEKALANVPVWAAQITEEGGVEVKEDIVVNKVYPLLAGAVVVAASYHP